MKKLIALVLALMLLLCSCGRAPQSDKESDETTTPTDGVVYEYSKGGNSERVTAVVTYEGGVEVSRDEYEYNIYGNVESINTIKDGKTVQTLSYVYGDGRITGSAKEFTDEGIACKEISSYNEKGYITSTTYYEDNERTGKKNYHYDDKGNMIRSEDVDEAENVLVYTAYTYNENKKIERADYYEFDSLTFYYIYEYDEEGKLLKVSQFDSEGNVISAK